MPRNSEVNFYLKPADANGKALIFLNFKYNNERFFFSFGERIRPEDWNSKKQRPKKALLTNDGEHSLTELIENLKKECENAFRIEKARGIPHPSTLRQYLQKFLNINSIMEDEHKPTLYKLIGRFLRGEVKHQGRDKTEATIQTYRSALHHLQEFERLEKFRIDFDTITLDFYYKFVDYLTKRAKNGKKKGHGLNNIGKQIKTIKVFMGEAVDLGYTNNMQFKHKKFITPSEESEGVYLNEIELLKLYNFDFSANKRLEQVRDLFIFGCYVGLRFSDFSDVRQENIVKAKGVEFIKVITKKTKEKVIIPCHPIVVDIFGRYKNNPNKLPKSLSNQKFNEYIKEVCREAKMDETGKLFKEPTKKLWECIESRTARRSFATNLYLDGYEVHEIMKITGHKTEKAFKTYIKASKLDSAERLNAFQQKRWAEKKFEIERKFLSVA